MLAAGAYAGYFTPLTSIVTFIQSRITVRVWAGSRPVISRTASTSISSSGPARSTPTGARR